MADIKLVVKIPEESYKLLNNKGIDWLGAEHILSAVANGIPLPKGHGDLKDQKDLAKSLYDYQWIDQRTYIEVTNRLINTPTIIEKDGD